MDQYQPHEQRDLAEKTDLDARAAKLAAFLDGELFAGLPLEDRRLLALQHDVMSAYSEVLGARIARSKAAGAAGAQP